MFVNDLVWDKVDYVDVVIGEMFDFYCSNGVYVEGVYIDIVILFNGWWDWLVSWIVEFLCLVKLCFLELYDFVVVKFVVGCEKDKVFVVVFI